MLQKSETPRWEKLARGLINAACRQAEVNAKRAERRKAAKHAIYGLEFRARLVQASK